MTRMAEYIGCRNCDSPDCRGCNMYALSRMLDSGKFDGLMNGNRSINPFADVVEVAELKEFAEDVVYQFGYAINYNGRLHLSSGGLSTLEWAFSILGWPDPKPYPEGECEWDGCHEHATCGTPTPYKLYPSLSRI